MLTHCTRITEDWPATDEVYSLKCFVNVVSAKINEVQRKVLYEISWSLLIISLGLLEWFNIPPCLLFILIILPLGYISDDG